MPELRAAVVRAGPRLETVEFLKGLELESAPVSEGEFGLSRWRYARCWSHRVSSARSMLTPELVAPLNANFLSLMRRRVRVLSLSDAQRRIVLKRGYGYKAALRRAQTADAAMG